MPSPSETPNDPGLALGPEQRALLAMQAGGPVPQWLLRLDIEGRLDAARLQAAVAQLLQRHEALRLAVQQPSPGRGARQRVLAAPRPVQWRVLHLPAADEALLAQPLAEFAATPLALADGDMLRGLLLSRGEGRWTVALAVSALAADRGSLRTLAAELAAAYADAAPGAAPAFPYRQYLQWRDSLQDGDADGRAYWDAWQAEAGGAASPRLAHRREGPPAGRRHRVAAELDDALCQALVRAGRALGHGVERIGQAAWWLLLARIAGEPRFLAGWQHDCRHDYEPMQGGVGLYDKVLPLCIEIDPAAGFAGWLARLDEIASAHADAQEAWPVEAPPLAGHLAVGYAFDAAAPLPAAGGLQWQLGGLPGPLPCFELALELRWDGGQGQAALWADAGHYSEPALQRLLQQYLTLLASALAEPQAATGTLAVVGPHEQAALLALNQASADFGSEGVDAHIARWAQQTPDAPALECGAQVLSYAQLLAQAESLAQGLRARGVGPGTLVALALPRSVDLVVALLACWRAGAGYLPLEPDWPEARRRAVLADASPALLLDAAALQALRAAPAPAAGALPACRLEDVAYVLYTSGSTGTPKGVVIEHRQLLNYVAGATARLPLAGSRRWALTGTVAADLGNTALFGALYHGACLVVAEAHEMADGASFCRFMRERAIDGLKMVPSQLEALLEGQAPPLPRLLVLGGEAAPRSLVERIAALAPDCAVYNHYGPTETTVGVMVHAVAAGAAAEAALPLTAVLPNNRVYVLDAERRLAPTGALGELYVGGAQLCRGYLGQPAGALFVADPFRPGERLYRTGDLARWRPEGGVQLAGRADHQLKVRGFRVEPAEIEAALLGLPGVRQAAVLPAAAGGELLAFVVADNARAADLREALAALLPAHMVPARYQCVAHFPRLPNGKVDRRALAALAEAAPTAAEVQAPRDALEALLVAGMAQLLGRERIGADESFFELGGHSLLVIKLVARIRKLLKVDIAPAAVFDHPSPAALAAVLRAASPDPAALARLEQAATPQA
ncbi:non-ribosomal peptide synthetase [Eleftheria terrae]|uniref:non-ribosomal peptide synthetase n=1 Tax=Eleftheria terrae TaxID=1597781 RepID=UPI00263AA0E3|nr:non-ribosomal peptide synthetase [Eleftheria terrae]WKB55456.1 amino acid adenylation domain-containing protein [Eleftheria terrae]